MNDQSEISIFKSKSGLKRIISAFIYSLEGLKSAWKSEHAFRQEIALVIPASIIAVFLPVLPLEKLLMVLVLVFVLIVELINSAIEAVVDRISLEKHPLSKNAKDFGSAAVFLTCCCAFLTWSTILSTHFLF